MLTNRLSTIHSKRRSGDDEGFTLIELLVVVVILGILIAIAIPTYLNYRKSAADKSAQSDARNAVTVLEACAVDGAYPSAVTSAGVMTGCDGQKMTVSTNSSLAYFRSGDASAFIVSATNSGGSGKIYCYSSAAGGSVTTTTTAVTAYRAAC